MLRPHILYSAEIVIGLVGAVGTDLARVGDDLTSALSDVGYRAFPIRLSTALGEVDPEVKALPPDIPYDSRLSQLMDAGDRLRRARGDQAMVALAVGAIQECRDAARRDAGLPVFPPPDDVDGASLPDQELDPEAANAPGEPKDRFAYILHQLKRPEEVDLLRRIYGPAFILVAAYAPRSFRRDTLSAKIAESDHDYRREDYRARAEALIDRDLSDRDEPHGQDVRKTFHRADVVVDMRDAGRRRSQIARFVELLFGNSLHTPSRDEQAMFHAQAAAYRSASLGRQVGSAITSSDGDLLAVGANDVPKAGGGLYWPDDPGEARDHQLGYDPSDRMKRDVFVDILKELLREGWLADSRAKMSLGELVAEALDENTGCLKDAHFMNLIEFMRPVHAEMAAISDCARRGVALQGTTLYVTAFPCHACAKHIVAVGIARVVYVEPYPKSLTMDLYSDSVRVVGEGEGDGKEHRVAFEPFLGIAPRRFVDWFTKGNRKGRSGKVVQWEETRETAPARLGDWVATLNTTAVREIDAFTKIMGRQPTTEGEAHA